MHVTLRKGNKKLKTTLLQAKENQNANGRSVKCVKQYSHKKRTQKQ